MMLSGLIALALTDATVPASAATFPERMPGMIRDCLLTAVQNQKISKTKDDHKYICTGEAAESLWAFLDGAKVESYEQTADGGIWVSREFPLGGCFKRRANADGSESSPALSCTIWIPRK